MRTYGFMHAIAQNAQCSQLVGYSLSLASKRQAGMHALMEHLASCMQTFFKLDLPTSANIISRPREEMAAEGRCIACGGFFCPGKREWPELVGMKGSEAKKIIERENPYVEAVYIWCHGKRIMNCCCNRVFLGIDVKPGEDYGEANVCSIPRVG